MISSLIISAYTISEPFKEGSLKPLNSGILFPGWRGDAGGPVQNAADLPFKNFPVGSDQNIVIVLFPFNGRSLGVKITFFNPVTFFRPGAAVDRVGSILYQGFELPAVFFVGMARSGANKAGLYTGGNHAGKVLLCLETLGPLEQSFQVGPRGPAEKDKLILILREFFHLPEAAANITVYPYRNSPARFHILMIPYF
jgi:hypothetical protein